jgi:transposase
MTRRYGLAPSGERAMGVVPFRRGVTMTLVLGLGLAGIVEPCTFEGAINGHIFGDYMAEQVLPHLPSDAVVVVDNLGAHHSEEACDALEARGVIVVESPAEACLEPKAPGIQMWFLPPYSPEFTPAEECGSKVKVLTRAAEPRTKDALIDAMGQAIGRVTSTDARGWFDHALRGRARRPRPEVPNRGADEGGTDPGEQPRRAGASG